MAIEGVVGMFGDVGGEQSRIAEGMGRSSVD